MARLFDNYIMLDWSASSKPNTGSDSIWIYILKRDVRLQLRGESHNPATRHAAMEIIERELSAFAKRGDKTLVGFDFAIGYPNGTAAALKLADAPWSAMMKFLSKEIIDKPDNDNNRFQVASKMNRLISNSATPFWGCPPKMVNTYLQPTKSNTSLNLPELRICDSVGKVASSVFKLYTPGSVGSQSLTGIPYVQKLRDKFEKSRLWPFETGLKELNRDDIEDLDIIFCEIYPSLLKTKPNQGETKDLAQVRAIAEYFAKIDDDGKLEKEFSGKAKIEDSQKSIIENEEGWILGV